MLNYYEKKRRFSLILFYIEYLQDKVSYKKPDGGLAFWLKPIKETDLFQLKQKVNSKLVSFYTP